MNNFKKQSRVTLVGAGPGDPDLLTLKAVKALTTADVILYDALVNQAVMQHAPKNAFKIFVGKRKDKHQYTQEQINQLIVDSALTYGHAVRLKGGDSFVFGRGGEEMDYVESFGIPVAVIPGISSAMAVPAAQGISLTKRGISESFWVITGTTSYKKLSASIALATQAEATVVILMGMSKLPEIVALFQQENKGETPIAIIQNGTMPNEKIGVGKIDSIIKISEEKKLGSPAIIVIGEVVKESNKLKGFFEHLNNEKIIFLG